jgi:hypothetical protein
MAGEWTRQDVERSASVFSDEAEAQEVDRPGLRTSEDLNSYSAIPSMLPPRAVSAIRGRAG